MSASIMFNEDLTKCDISEEILNMIDLDCVLKYHLVPLKTENDVLIVVTGKIDNYKMLLQLREKIGLKFELYLTDTENIEKAINFYYDLPIPFKVSEKLRLDEKHNEKNRTKIDEADGEENTIIVQIFNNILRDAVDEGASDIHILPTENLSIVLFRINGRLVDYSSKYRIKSFLHPQIINRVKIICKPELDVSNTIMMQDGAFEMVQGNDGYDCRVSTTPTIKGEKVVIRLHNTAKGIKSLEELGFIKEDLEILYKLLLEPNGMFLVTGPTSSGKTTTLYGCLKTFDPKENIIMTIEDPVEMKIEGYCQVQTRHSDDEKLKLTFAKALRTALRQDPDILLVGEIRDGETATVALEASQTGHLMFSTLHTKNSIATLSRLMNMGVDKATLLSEIVCIIAQRLVGTNCPYCIRDYTLTKEDCSILTKEEITFLQSGKLKKSMGCNKCKKSGFLGRTVVAEFLIFDNDLRDFFLEVVKIKETLDYLKEKKKFKTLWEKGLELVYKGITTLDELVSIISRNA